MHTSTQVPELLRARPLYQPQAVSAIKTSQPPFFQPYLGPFFFFVHHLTSDDGELPLGGAVCQQRHRLFIIQGKALSL